MAKPPAVLIVVRHGARLDAADKQWHLGSPTPYDPPLTFGGWTQSRALGARIGSILRSRETDDEISVTDAVETDGVPTGDRRRRRHKVIIHTSPFLRCVQTSVAISSGLAQNTGHSLHPRNSPAPSIKEKSMHSSSPRVRPTIATDSPRLAAIIEPSSSTGKDVKEQLVEPAIKKSTIRVDAFLGEWLSPDYFELITPPPSSIMMVAGAKADLLRREDYNNLIHVRDIKSAATPFQGFPGGWGSPIVAKPLDKDKNSDVEEEPLSTMTSIGQALPRRDRTSSLSSASSGGSQSSKKTVTKSSTTNPVEHGIYQAPIPSYSVSTSDPIPPGYVSHARDACVDVDYQWDSMREPQNWGDGGEYGEEWSSMHKRFRKGLQQMLLWYRDNEDSGNSTVSSPGKKEPSFKFQSEDDDEDDTDLVVILVTHGAGCNALIGALTNQPVLIDVGMASLTMAVRKPSAIRSASGSPLNTPKSHSRTSSRTVTIPDEYDVKLVANTEHLRKSTSSPLSSRNGSVANVSTYRQRFGGNGGPFVDSSYEHRGTTPSSFGSIRRTATVATPPSRSLANTPRHNSVGLWSAPAPIEVAEDEDGPGDDMVLNFGDEEAIDSSEPAVEEAVTFELEPHPEEGEAPTGLWGTPRPPGEAEKMREMGTKRRWTVNERA